MSNFNSFETIEWISGPEPQRPGEYPLMYKVGFDGVTAINYREIIYGDHGIGEFVVMKDNKPFAVMVHRHVSDYGFKQDEN